MKAHLDDLTAGADASWDDAIAGETLQFMPRAKARAPPRQVLPIPKKDQDPGYILTKEGIHPMDKPLTTM
jgi:hypothetical protein